MTNDDNNTAPSLRSRQYASMAAHSSQQPNGQPSSSSSSSSTYPNNLPAKRNSPFLPTPLETLVLAAYPAILVFGALFSVLSPETRGALYDPAAQSHAPGAAPNYFARKDNVVNTLFVKRGWAWISAAFAAFVLTHPSFAHSGFRRTRAATRWLLVTAWWVLVTQWCFGAPIIDRGFRFTGGKCEVATEAVAVGAADAGDVFTAAACRAAGGRWSGGHDISGHVFLLVLGSFFLLQEVGWVMVRAGWFGGREERHVVMHDGAVKGAGVEAERNVPEDNTLGLGGRFAAVVVTLCGWMLLMTAIYFHTWFEKFTGLLVAAMAIYPIYILPRWIPALRAVVGLPGI
ncbi:inositol phospholipid synthesis and fat-storage-inducing TM-domain-containing protein [Hypomontagnella submonticulosa]|nr:inositol phospholipid synthesis and fat-storage-inducing TM-domain-containing protein [Hypomontagnella submonticulosa]